MLEAAGDAEGAKAVRQKMSEQNRQLRAYCEQNGLKYRSDRVRTYGAVIQPKAVGSTKNSSIPLTSSSNGGTIYPEDVTGQKLKDMIKRSNSLEKPIFAIDTPDNCFASRAALIKPEYGKYDVALHGIPTAAFFFEKKINARTLAIIIRNRPDYKAGTPVRLLSCNTGNTEKTGNCFAQLLANELRTTVYAPTKKLYVNPDGTIFVGKKKDGFFKDFIWRE